MKTPRAYARSITARIKYGGDGKERPIRYKVYLCELILIWRPHTNSRGV